MNKVLGFRILSGFSIVGSAITLFSGYGHLRVSSDWGAWLLTNWRSVVEGFETNTIHMLGIPPDTGWASLLLFAIFMTSVALEARVTTETDLRTLKGKFLTLLGITSVLAILLHMGWSGSRKTMNHEAIGFVFLFGAVYFGFYRTPNHWRLTVSSLVAVLYALAFALLLIAPGKKIVAHHDADIQLALLTGILVTSLVMPIWLSAARPLAVRVACILAAFATMVSADALMDMLNG